MRTRADAMIIQGAACADRSDMRAGVHTAIADTGAGGHDRAGMAARGNAMAIDSCARANRSDMGASAHAMFADMRAHSDTQYVHIRADGIGRNGREKRECEEASRERFHLVIPWISRCDNARSPLKFKASARR
jgi:hypothetical protein